MYIEETHICIHRKKKSQGNPNNKITMAICGLWFKGDFNNFFRPCFFR